MKKIIVIIFILSAIMLYIKKDMETIHNKNLLQEHTECYKNWRNKKVKINCKLIKSILNNKQNKWSLVFDYHEDVILSTKSLTVSFLKNTEYIIVDYYSIYGWVNIISKKEFKGLRDRIMLQENEN